MSEDEWLWRVVYTLPGEWREKIRSIRAPHRAAAKQTIAEHYDESLTFERCYIPRPSWDCPICGGSEGMTKRPNMESPPNWECFNCGCLGWGEPRDWEYLSEPTSKHGIMSGHKTPDGPRWDAPAAPSEEVNHAQ